MPYDTKNPTMKERLGALARVYALSSDLRYN